MKKFIGKLLVKIPFLRYAYLYKYHSNFRPGHYYSPVANRDELIAREDAIWRPKDLKGIDINKNEQKEFLHYLLTNEKAFEVPTRQTPSKKYAGSSLSYPYVDGVTLHAMIAKYKPKRIIEVGSGSSSACMVDTIVQHKLDTSLTFIEPWPVWCLDKVLQKEEYGKFNITLVEKIVQDVPLEVFKQLERNDILFIDSSHVAKPGSDVNFLMTEVLPVLKEGVIIHFHDIYYPFEYTREYLLGEKLLWSEAYSLHNFLLFNDYFKILFFSDYMKQQLKTDPAFASEFKQSETSVFRNDETRPKNIWIQRK